LSFCILSETLPKEKTLKSLLYDIVGDGEALIQLKQNRMHFMQTEIGQLLSRGRENSAHLKV